MPLVDLLNNLANFPYYYGGTGNFIQKSLKYGRDQQFGASSDEPYIQWPFPENADGKTRQYYTGNLASLDFPVRGSSLTRLGNGLIVPSAAEYDFKRIQKFIKSSPKGYTFVAKQIGLQLTNPKMEVGSQANLNPGRNTTARFFGLIENTRVYNGGLNTLAQVRLAGSGIHADRHGTVPYNPFSQTYERVVQSYNLANQGADNRLVTLLNTKILPATRATDTSSTSNLENLQRLGISRTNKNLLFSYPGGPGSVYGIGLTTIPRYADNSDLLRTNPASSLYKNQEGETTTLADIYVLTKEGLKSTKAGYLKYTEQSNLERPNTDNRLVALLRSKMYSAETTTNKNLYIPQDRTTLIQYPGGPNSERGLGTTTIQRYQDNSDLYKANPATSLYANAQGVNATLQDILITKPEDLQANAPGYVKYTQTSNKAKPDTDNRLVALLKAKIFTKQTTTANKNLFIPEDRFTLLKYEGGPGAKRGIGQTIIKRNPDFDTSPLYDVNPPIPLYQNGTYKTLKELLQTTAYVDKTVTVAKAGLFGSVPYGQTLTNNTVDVNNESRLAVLAGKLIGKSADFSDKQIIKGNDKVTTNPSNPNVIYEYPIGPSDKVILKRETNTGDKTDTLNSSANPGDPNNSNNGAKTFNYSLLYKQSVLGASGKKWTDANLTDFRSTIEGAAGGAGSFSPDKIGYKLVDYTTNNLQSRIGIAGPGRSDKVTAAPVGQDYDPEKSIADLIKFRFEALMYSGAVIPVLFRAYLTSFSDNNTAELSPFRYVGRGENFYVYNGFSRTLSFNFKLAAESKQELKPMYQKLNFLQSQLYPDYQSSGFMRSPVVKLTLGDYIYKQPGFLTSMNITVADSYPWEINLDGDMFEAPQLVDVSCQFTPIHDFLPRRSTSATNITPLSFQQQLKA
jgi:hypothetical protein